MFRRTSLNAHDIFTKWLSVLEEYWKECEAFIVKLDIPGDFDKENGKIEEKNISREDKDKEDEGKEDKDKEYKTIKSLLMSCPILEDFKENKLDMPAESIHKYSVFDDSYPDLKIKIVDNNKNS